MDNLQGCPRQQTVWHPFVQVKISGITPIGLENKRPGHESRLEQDVEYRDSWTWLVGTQKGSSHAGKWSGGFLEGGTLTMTRRSPAAKYYPGVMKTDISTETRVWPFRAAFSKIMPNWTQHNVLPQVHGDTSRSTHQP